MKKINNYEVFIPTLDICNSTPILKAQSTTHKWTEKNKMAKRTSTILCLIKMIGVFAPMNDQQYGSLPKISASLYESTFHSIQRKSLSLVKEM